MMCTCVVCKKNVTSITVPNVTGVPKVTNVPKMTQYDASVPKMCLQTATWCTNQCSVPTGVLNVTCTKMHQLQKNTRRDRSRCDDMRYQTKIALHLRMMSRKRPDDDSDHAKCRVVAAVVVHCESKNIPLYSCAKLWQMLTNF